VVGPDSIGARPEMQQGLNPGQFRPIDRTYRCLLALGTTVDICKLNQNIMAQGRMVMKEISTSERVAELPIDGQLLYERCIVHADDLCLLPFSARKIKHAAIPFIDDIDTERTQELIDLMVKKDLFKIFEYKGEKYYHILRNKQILKKDRQPQTILEIDFKKDPKSSWLEAEKIMMEAVGNHLEDNGIQMETEEKRREENRNKYNGTKNAVATPDVKKSENKSSVTSIGSILQKLSIPESKNGISTKWQDKGFRYADKLNIILPNELKGRWLKIFKECDQDPAKNKILESTYLYLIDYIPFTSLKTDKDKVMYFFKIYDNGGPKKNQSGFISLKYLLFVLIITLSLNLYVFGFRSAGSADSDLPGKRLNNSLPVRRPTLGTPKPTTVLPTVSPTIAFSEKVNKVSIEEKIRAKFGEFAVIAIALANAESGFNCDAVSPTNDHGLFQINAVHFWRFKGKSQYDCQANIDVAYEIFTEQGFNPWSAYKSGAYKRFL
jgi:hypothetical protein